MEEKVWAQSQHFLNKNGGSKGCEYEKCHLGRKAWKSFLNKEHLNKNIFILGQKNT